MSKPFKIHCITLAKNEADVIALCLSEAAQWADYIYVYDNASTDGTWEIVKSLKIPAVIPWKQHGQVFREGLRAEVFQEFRHLSSEGDWWLRLDVDEFYPSDPRDYFAGVAAAYNFVWGIFVQYYLTEKDIAELDFSLPFEQIKPRLRYYKVDWSEPRAFRYRRRLVWHGDWAWPLHAGLVAPRRIVFQHYHYRSPAQIQMRLDVRRDNRSRGFKGWDHAKDLEWSAKIVNHAECLEDKGCRPLLIDETKLSRHLEPPLVRVVKRFMHGSSLWP